MKLPTLLLAFLLIGITCVGQETKDALHPIVQRAKETSLYANQVNWQEVNTTFVALTKDKSNQTDYIKGLQYLINSLGDKHGQFRSAKDNSLIVSYTGAVKEATNRDPQFVNTVINDVSARFSYQLLNNSIGYLRVVGIGPGDVKAQSDVIRQGVVDLKSKGADKWIVDLRYNGGGNMEPMIAGLAPLIGEGFIAGSVNKDNETREYIIENGQFFNFGRLACQMDNLPEINPKEKVAVLLSRYTISSGELLAVAFKGRENTRFIGEPTAGYTTGNGYDVVTDDLVLIISQDVFIDRNKNKYEGNVGVDQESEFQHNLTTENDNQITLAKDWLLE